MSRDGPAPESTVALAGEIIGAALSLTRHPGVATVPLEGTIVDETLNTFLVRPVGSERVVRISKTGAQGTILLGGREIPLNGDTLRVRPEDRTKRLLGRGRRSLP